MKSIDRIRNMKTPINVLHLIDHYKIGGPGKTIINSARYIDNSNFKIHVASFTANENDESEFARAVVSNQIPYLKLVDRKGFQLEWISRINAYMQQNDIKILHTHVYKSDILGLLVRLVNKKIILITTHHGWIANSSRQKIIVRGAAFLSRFFDGVISVSKELSKTLPKGVMGSDKSTIIHNGLILGDYQNNGKRDYIRNRYGVRKTDILIGICGRLSPEKGCTEALDIFHKANKSFDRLKLFFIGEGPMLEELRQKVDSLGLQNEVIFIGYQKNVSPFYEALDILLSPSKTEGLSNVILEAMAHKIPVIATDVGGNSEIVTHNYNGILVKPNDTDIIEQELVKLSHQPRKRDYLSENGYKTIINKFDFEARMRKVENFYMQTLSMSGHSMTVN